MTSLFGYLTSRLANPGLADIEDALNRVQALSAKHSEQAEIISLGATAWAYGITPEMMDVFGRIASSMRITAEDLRQLERHGIENRAVPKPRTVTYEVTLDTGPFEEALKRYVEDCGPKPRKPWLDAKDGEIWVLTGAGGLEQPWRRMDNGTWVSCFSTRQRYSAEQAIAGRRIWPEAGDDQ